MALELSINKLRETGDLRDEAYAKVIEMILQERGSDIILPNSTQIQKTITPDPEIDLKFIWENQAYKLADLFAAELGLSRRQYIDRLPKFDAHLDLTGDRFDIPLLVQTPVGKLTLPRMCEIAGVFNYLDSNKVKDWQEDPGKFETPPTPYATWLHDGGMNLGRRIMDVKNGLVAGERGGTVYDGLALFVQHPDILKRHYLNLPGSQSGSGLAPYLYFWVDRPKLNDGWVANAYPRCGSVVARRNIVTR